MPIKTPKNFVSKKRIYLICVAEYDTDINVLKILLERLRQSTKINRVNYPIYFCLYSNLREEQSSLALDNIVHRYKTLG